MTHASLFSGIGGFDLAAEWAGWTNVFNCEIDPFCRRVLAYHFPNAIQYEDVKTTDFTIHRGGVDVLTGGFPCQPFSLAGKRKGTDDNRHLWPEMLRAIRELAPRWVVGENVCGIVNWSDGMVFEQVCADLENEGYKVQPYLIPACAVDAPHRRDRVWFVAHQRNVADGSNAGLKILQRKGTIGVYESGVSTDTNCELRRERRFGCTGEIENKTFGSNIQLDPERFSEVGVVTDTQSARQQTRPARQKEIEPRGGDSGELRRRYFDGFPTQSPVCGRNDGLSARLDGITFPAWRRESIKAYGNAVVPQVVLQIFQTINEYKNALQTEIPDTREG